MICEKCKHEFVKPLELFNGTLSCPLCHADLVGTDSDYCEITKQNDELFKLAEICYHYALKAKSQKEYREGVQRAIALCKNAAWLKHPKARIRMGYYYETGYIACDSGIAAKIAKQYFKSVWNADISYDKDFEMEYKDEINTLKEIAATRYLAIVKSESDILFAREREAVIKAGLRVGKIYAESDVTTSDKVTRLLKILEEYCFSEERAPICGIIGLSGKDVARIMGDEDKLKILLDVAPLVKVVIFDGNTIDKDLWCIKDKSSVEQMPYKVDGKYYVYFFNTKGAHEISTGKLLQVQKVIEKDEYEMAYQFVQRARASKSDYVFYDDDVLKFKSKHESFSHATEDFIKYVTQGEE